VVVVRGDRVRLGIRAPTTVRVDRQEVHERRPLSLCPPGPGVEEVCPLTEDDRCR
jgi:hypothetical protein